MAPRAAHRAVGGNTGVEEQRATQSDARRGDGKLRGRHVLWKRLEEALCLFEEIVVVACKRGFRDETGGDRARDKANDPRSSVISEFESFHENPPEVYRLSIRAPDRHELRSSTNTSMGSG